MSSRPFDPLQDLRDQLVRKVLEALRDHPGFRVYLAEGALRAIQESPDQQALEDLQVRLGALLTPRPSASK
jgi:hypothetical protein